MSGKDQQKMASQKYQEFKKSLKDQSSQNKDDKGLGENQEGLKDESQSDDISLEVLIQAEKRIRSVGVDVNSVISIGREVIPDGELIKHGNEGVNTRVTYEDKKGNKLPINGNFIVFI
ncbi:MAG: hypothetical protein PHQ91_15090 [Thermoanaerobaculaceae bacterium]|nr:hypothetical protein [Thermoanaerobaculaceae bacterium]